MRRRCALLVNPTSGGGRSAAVVPQVCHRLERGGLAVTLMQGADGDEAADLARAAVGDEYDVLAVMGGDGLIHLALPALAGAATALGVIPAGTGNDVARYLSLPRGRPLAAADVVAAGGTRSIDLARAGTTYFVTVLAAGFDSLVAERANAMRRPRGQLRYTLATLAELPVFRPRAYTLELDGRRLSTEAMLVAVGNGPSYGGGLRICEGAVLDDGLLDVVVIEPMSKAEFVRVYPRVFRGTHVTHPRYSSTRVRRVSIASADLVGYADGERVGVLPLTVEVVPAALTVCVPVP